VIPSADITAAREKAEASIAKALANGDTPRINDLFVVHLLQPRPTFLRRVRGAAFPLVITTFAFLLMLASAFMHPPIVEADGRVEATAFTLHVAASELKPDILEIQSFDNSKPLTIFGFSVADLMDCASPSQSSDSLQALGVNVSIVGPANFTGHFNRLYAANGHDKLVQLSFETDTQAVIKLSQIVLDAAQSKQCSNTEFVLLRPPKEENINVAVEPIAANLVPSILMLPRLKVTEARFIDHDPFGAAQHCSIRGAQFRVVQRIWFLGIEREHTKTVPEGTCLYFKASDDQSWDMRLSASPEGFQLRFHGVALPSLDNGIGDSTLLITYLDALIQDPTLGSLFGAIAFILTTLWSVVTFVRELWK